MQGNIYNNINSFNEKDMFVKENLINMGFDFSMLGSFYLKDIIHIVIGQPQILHSVCTKLMDIVATKYNKTRKSVCGDIRWAIKKAFNKGVLKTVPCFCGDKVPPTRQILSFLFDFFM